MNVKTKEELVEALKSSKTTVEFVPLHLLRELVGEQLPQLYAEPSLIPVNVEKALNVILQTQQ